MDKKAEVIAKLIKEKGYSKRAFAEKVGIPPTTLQSMLVRGIGRASVDNVIKICQALGITVEELKRLAGEGEDIKTLAAHHEGEEWTEEELEEIERFKEFIRSKRNKKEQ